LLKQAVRLRRPRTYVGSLANASHNNEPVTALKQELQMSRRVSQLTRKRPSPFTPTLLAGALASLSYGVQAEQQLELETTVVTAAGYEQSVKDAPASISVITAEELKKRSYTDVTDALKNVAGVQVIGGGVEQSISIRGMTSGYTLFLIDGRPVQGNDALVSVAPRPAHRSTSCRRSKPSSASK
jgi:outer membrane receptor protein involved in Fe transport